MKKLPLLLLLLALTLAGCASALLTPLVIFRGTDVQPEFDILLRGDLRVAVVPRSVAFNAFELQNAPNEIARHVNHLLDTRSTNKRLRVVEQSRVESWLDNVNNNFDTFVEVGRDMNADIVIGFNVVGFQIRDPQNPYLIQGRSMVQVEAFDVATGRLLASHTIQIVNPPNVPLHATDPSIEPRFRQRFVEVIAQHIAALFHPHNPHQLRQIDADSLNLHR
jgi:hypothetical protein